MIPYSWEEMICPLTQIVEKRKVAKPDFDIFGWLFVSNQSLLASSKLYIWSSKFTTFLNSRDFS